MLFRSGWNRGWEGSRASGLVGWGLWIGPLRMGVVDLCAGGRTVGIPHGGDSPHWPDAGPPSPRLAQILGRSPPVTENRRGGWAALPPHLHSVWVSPEAIPWPIRPQTSLRWVDGEWVAELQRLAISVITGCEYSATPLVLHREQGMSLGARIYSHCTGVPTAAAAEYSSPGHPEHP